jgi:WD40 repeat protein
VELDHAIGFSGKINNSVFLHPNAKEYLMIAGCSVITGDLIDPHSQHFLTAHDDLITCFAISNQGNLLASGQQGDNSDVVIWDYNSKKAIFRLSEHDYAVTNLAFSHDDALLISIGSQLDGKLFIWNTLNGHIVSSLQVTPTIFPDGISSVCWGGFVKTKQLKNTQNYQFAIAGSKKLTLWNLDPTNGSCTYETLQAGSMVRDYSCLTFSKPNEEFVFAGTNSGDFCSFQVKNKLFVFSQPACA